MRALHIPAAGEPPQLSDLPAPTVTEGTVLVRVKAAGLNPIDTAIAGGMVAQMMQHTYPVVLGRDAAGIVEAVGAGVDHVRVGDEVIGHVIFAPPIEVGTLAELALLPASAVTLKPAGIDFTTAAAIPLAATAAATAIDAVDPKPGETVLVNGASGGVGSYAVQLLAARGVTVIATGTKEDADRLPSLGAGRVVDFTEGLVAEQVRAIQPNGVDAMINLVGFTNDDVPLDAVRKGGKVATTTSAPDADALAAAGMTGGTIMAMPLREVVGPLAEQVASGALKVELAAVLPLEQATEGLETMAAGNAKGKIVVIIDG